LSESPTWEDLRSRWRILTASVGVVERAADIGEALIAAYAEPHRRYHSLSHVRWLLEEEQRRAALIRDRALVQFAIWFHDAIYQPVEKDNEERSAEWAKAALAQLNLPDLAQSVSALVLKTKDHAKGEASPDEALFLDMDIAILGAQRADYAAYAKGVREEYSAVPDAAFAAGRGAFLQSWLARERLFRTDVYHAELDQAARANMTWELEQYGNRAIESISTERKCTGR
jgi:predicted metal-dependent HD superfamily phosphohydrolase